MPQSPPSGAFRKLSSRLAAVQGVVLLTVVYCLALPMAVFLRLRDPLQLRERGASSLWKPRRRPVETAETLRRLF